MLPTFIVDKLIFRTSLANSMTTAPFCSLKFPRISSLISAIYLFLVKTDSRVAIGTVVVLLYSSNYVFNVFNSEGLADIRSMGSSLSTTSFICQEFLPSGLLHHGKYGTDDWCKPIKVEDGTDYRPLSTIPVTNGNLHSKSLLPHDIGKHFASFHDNGASTATGSTFCENTSQYTNDVGCPTSSSHSLFQNTPLASEDFNVFNAASTVQGLSTISDSGCALSLLSSHSQKSSSHSSGIPMARPLIMPGSHPHYGMSRVSENFRGIASQDSLSGMSNKFPSSEMNSAEENHLGPILISDSSGAVNFEITDRMFQRSDCLNSDNCHSCENGPTMDLLQLSSQLQRVEHQRQFMQMKQDNDAFCCLRIT